MQLIIVITEGISTKYLLKLLSFLYIFVKFTTKKGSKKCTSVICLNKTLMHAKT